MKIFHVILRHIYLSIHHETPCKLVNSRKLPKKGFLPIAMTHLHIHKSPTKVSISDVKE